MRMCAYAPHCVPQTLQIIFFSFSFVIFWQKDIKLWCSKTTKTQKDKDDFKENSCGYCSVTTMGISKSLEPSTIRLKTMLSTFPILIRLKIFSILPKEWKHQKTFLFIFLPQNWWLRYTSTKI